MRRVRKRRQDPVPTIGKRFLTPLALLRSLAFSLPDRERTAAAFVGGEVLGTLLVGTSHVELQRVSVEFVDPEQLLSLVVPLGHGVVDGLGLFSRVEDDLGLHVDGVVDRYRKLIV